jgi:hypothetical protein
MAVTGGAKTSNADGSAGLLAGARMAGTPGKPLSINRFSSSSYKPAKAALPERNGFLVLIALSSRDRKSVRSNPTCTECELFHFSGLLNVNA